MVKSDTMQHTRPGQLFSVFMNIDAVILSNQM